MALIRILPFKAAVNADIYVHNDNPVNEELFSLKFRPPFLGYRRRAIRGINTFIFIDDVAPSTQTWTQETRQAASWGIEARQAASWDAETRQAATWDEESRVPLS